MLLAMALANNPELIFLDEPTTGLDPQARRHLWDIVGMIKSEGKTVVLTTHYMEEAEILCEDIAILDCGKVIARGSPDRLLEESGSETTIQFKGKALVTDRAFLLKDLKRSGAVRKIRENPDGFELFTDRTNICLELLIKHQVDLSDINVRSKNLEDLFLQLTGRGLRD